MKLGKKKWRKLVVNTESINIWLTGVSEKGDKENRVEIIVKNNTMNFLKMDMKF